MALIDCPECGIPTSDQAVSCPGCGFPVAAKRPQERKPPQKAFLSDSPGYISPKGLAPISATSSVPKIIGWVFLATLALLAAFLSIGHSIRASRSPEQNQDLDVIRTCRKIVENRQFPIGACSQMESDYYSTWGERP